MYNPEDREKARKHTLFPIQRDKVLTVMIQRIVDKSPDGNLNYEVLLSQIIKKKATMKYMGTVSSNRKFLFIIPRDML